MRREAFLSLSLLPVGTVENVFVIGLVCCHRVGWLEVGGVGVFVGGVGVVSVVTDACWA